MPDRSGTIEFFGAKMVENLRAESLDSFPFVVDPHVVASETNGRYLKCFPTKDLYNVIPVVGVTNDKRATWTLKNRGLCITPTICFRPLKLIFRRLIQRPNNNGIIFLLP